jgi:hypothetical protein
MVSVDGFYYTWMTLAATEAEQANCKLPFPYLLLYMCIKEHGYGI